MKNKEDVLSKRERFINLIFYVFRYTLYLIAFSCLWIIVGKIFSVVLVIVFWFLAQCHVEYKIKIQKSITIQENCKCEELLKKVDKNEENV